MRARTCKVAGSTMATVLSLFGSTRSVDADACQRILRRNVLATLIALPPNFWKGSLQRSTRRRSRCPGPLKVEAAEVARHVDDFTDEVKTWDFADVHRLGRQFVGVDSAGGHFGFLVAFRARGDDGPRMRLLLEISQRGVRP